MKKLLVGSDFSDDARNAALRAGRIAQEQGLDRVGLLHVMPDLPMPAALELRASGAIERALGAHAAELERECGLRFEPRLASGAVADAIAAASAGEDLVVLGARGLHPLRDFAIGTSAERVLRKSRVPVLVVKRPPQAPYRRALVAVDFSNGAREALARAAAVAPHAELDLVHAYEVEFESTLRLAGSAEQEIQRYRREAKEQAQLAMEAVAAPYAERVTRHIEHGYAPRVIADAEARLGADLLALGKHGKSAIEELLLGSVTLHALAAARCDVLMVPHRHS